MVMNAIFGGQQAVHLGVIVNGNIILKVKELIENLGKNNLQIFIKNIIEILKMYTQKKKKKIHRAI